MKLVKAFFIAASFLLCIANAQANISGCVNSQSETWVSGVIGAKATYVDPQDFGWAPANGFVAYTVIYIDQPVCFSEDGETIPSAHIIQLASNQALGAFEGRRVNLKGTFFTNHTAHHFEQLLLNVSEIVIR